jgi:hypothetical protein
MYAVCIRKVRGFNNKITGYVLRNKDTNQLVKMDPYWLKKAIRENQITVANLKLTSDNRLIDVKTKQPSANTNAQASHCNMNTPLKTGIGENDPYLEEVIETQGLLFENVVYDGGDMIDFVNKYMNSELKSGIDKRWAWHSNLLYPEQLEELEKEEHITPIKSQGFNDYMLASWIGEFYAWIQWYTQMSSAFIIRMLPIKEFIVMARGLHDLDMELVVQKILKQNVICFHNPNEENAYLSNWYHCYFTVNNIIFSSMEQFMMYSKALLFKDKEVADSILNTDDFKEIKALGRQVKNFDEDTWNKNKQQIIYKGLHEKFSQNNELKEQLKGTGYKILAECAVNDKIWGIGLSMKD